MIVARLAHPADFEGWRRQARALARRNVSAGEIAWVVGDEPAGLFEGESVDPAAATEGPELTVPRDFPDLAAQVICHSDAERFSLLYRLLLRLQREAHLLKVATDADVHKAEAMARSDPARHAQDDCLRALPRDRRRRRPARPYIAWFEPEHFIVERVASFFVKRFSAMRWSILTP